MQVSAMPPRMGRSTRRPISRSAARDGARTATRRSQQGPPRRRGVRRARSANGNRAAAGLEDLLGLARDVLGFLLEDGLPSGLHELLGLLETEGGEATHLLDDLDAYMSHGLDRLVD